MVEEHHQTLGLGFFRRTSEFERYALLNPLLHPVRTFIREDEGHTFEIDHDRLCRTNRRCVQRKDNRRKYEGRASRHALVISKPDIVPVADANLSVSIPKRCSIETKRLGSG